MSEIVQKKSSFLARLLPRIENFDQLHIVLSVVVVFFGLMIIVVGAFLPYLGEGGGETDISELKRFFTDGNGRLVVDHAFTVMMIGVALVIMGLQASFVETWKKFRGEKVEVVVNLEGIVMRDELKKVAFKK